MHLVGKVMTLDPQARDILQVMTQNPAPKPQDLPVHQFRAAIADVSKCAFCFTAVLERMYDPVFRCATQAQDCA